MEEVTKNEKLQVLADEAKAIIDVLSSHDEIGFADYMLCALLAECVGRGTVKPSEAPETVMTIHAPEHFAGELRCEHYHINGAAMLGNIRDSDLLELACDILARLNKEQEDRDEEDEDDGRQWFSSLIQ